MSVRGSEQAVVTDFDEAFGQDVLKEAADKLLGGNGRESGPISGRILVGKSHLAILEGEDPAIADGDAKDVRSEVFEGGGACAYRLRVNDPIFAPDLLIKEMEETVVSRPGQFNIGLLAQQVQRALALRIDIVSIFDGFRGSPALLMIMGRNDGGRARRKAINPMNQFSYRSSH